MKFGIWYHLRNPGRWKQPAQDLYRKTLDQIVAAEKLGYDSVWVSEHHFTDDGYLPSSLLFLAAVAARTTRIRLGTLILLLPLHHPLRVAEDAAVLDILSSGRVDLGVAAGYRVEEFEAFEVAHKERGRRMDEAVEILQRSWGAAQFSAKTPDFSFLNVSVTPKPIQPGGPPIWMGGQSRAAIRRAARFGCHLLPSPSKEFDVVETYHAALREYGRDPDNFRIKGFSSMFCTEDPARSWEELKEHFLYQHNLYRQWYRSAGDSTAPDVKDADQLSRNNYFVGTPDECDKEIREHQRNLSAEEFIFWAHPPGFPVEKSTPSIELFAKEVIPRFH
jgi:probable F420-dependent oxidoreductase